MGPKLQSLRYRIDPTQKKLDELDQLEAELRAVRNSVDDDDYHAMARHLLERRQKLLKGRKTAPEEPVTVFEPEPILSYWIRTGRLEGPFKAFLACSVIGWLLFKNF